MTHRRTGGRRAAYNHACNVCTWASPPRSRSGVTQVLKIAATRINGRNPLRAGHDCYYNTRRVWGAVSKIHAPPARSGIAGRRATGCRVTVTLQAILPCALAFGWPSVLGLLDVVVAEQLPRFGAGRGVTRMQVPDNSNQSHRFRAAAHLVSHGTGQGFRARCPPATPPPRGVAVRAVIAWHLVSWVGVGLRHPGFAVVDGREKLP
ncbi:hypothetical protein B0T26DRAFT_725762 [Lasiosphaeria miniovina]|uniref:Uncharacterized protein n=1 Tax=Lasiosphaeria miniovina TaxID=1954250 RepID=A0AA40DM19_9PEZI|nr:uncharacterized protein B0T26DRAFT_725762 [Lasiosphaeria miniovina]KAK0706206.1 hypothetical protein B0T26DRAFT_725762 [Lasiosphaeria miniovina]